MILLQPVAKPPLTSGASAENIRRHPEFYYSTKELSLSKIKHLDNSFSDIYLQYQNVDKKSNTRH